MSDATRIAWTDATWNPISGCSHASPGCDHCYAEALSHRFRWTAKPWTMPNARENVQLHPERLTMPLRWRKPRRIFVASMGDLFHEQVSDEFIDKVFAVIWLARQHTFQILTKRPERMRRYLTERVPYPGMPELYSRSFPIFKATEALFGWTAANHQYGSVPPNLWLGVTAEDQRRADERIPLLLQTPAAVRFVSVEPMLGPVNLRDILYEPPDDGLMALDALGNEEWALLEPPPISTTLDWVIVGAESGATARPMEVGWVRSLRDQCQAAGVAFFYKQAMSDGKLDHEPALDGQTWRQFPMRP